jgi:class 3 adenylate cyclase
MERLVASLREMTWTLVRWAVGTIRYEPSRLDLALAHGVSGGRVPAPVARWVTAEHARPAVDRLGGIPYGILRRAIVAAEALLGPPGAALVRWLSAAVLSGVDRAAAEALGPRLGLLVPHLHDVAVLALDMRGFSRLTSELRDTQYLADLIGEYLSEMTRVVETQHGVVFQYTGDGLLAIFLPEATDSTAAATLERLVHETSRDLHAAFDRLAARWHAEWAEAGRPHTAVGLGIGISCGPATIGLIGPAGKKQFGVVGEPVNLAAFLCSQAYAGTALVDREAFARAAAPVPDGARVRLKSKKRHQRLDAVGLRFGEL